MREYGIMEWKQMRADVIIPVYRPDEKFFLLISRLMRQSIRPEKIILMNTERELWDTSGAEERLEELEAADLCEIHHVTKREFDHGGTRNLGVSFSRAPYFVMMTQDAVPVNDSLIERLLSPIGEEVAETYARQLPAKDADPIEKFSRYFNYPPESAVKGIVDLKRLGIRTYFASNVCAAYDRSVFDELGGFPERTIFNEDMIYAASLLKSGRKIAYIAEAMVRHSHSYTSIQQFHRNFDLAVSQADHPEVFGGIRSESEGIRLVRRTARWLIRTGNARYLPHLVFSCAAKYAGYLLGKHYRMLPLLLVRQCSMNNSYWEKANE